MGSGLQGLNAASNEVRHDLNAGHLLAHSVAEETDSFHELFYLGSFDWVQLICLSSFLSDLGASREWLESIQLAWTRFIADVEPSSSLALGGVNHV